MCIAKNCDLDLSVKWSRALFRNSKDIVDINECTSEFCMPGWALVHFSECHVMWFGPITSGYFAMRYSDKLYKFIIKIQPLSSLLVTFHWCRLWNETPSYLWLPTVHRGDTWRTGKSCNLMTLYNVLVAVHSWWLVCVCVEYSWPIVQWK